MKYLGIDYGEKNIGLAVSDSLGKVSLPLKIINNDYKVWDNLKKVLDEEKIESIVFGKSLDFSGKPNKVNFLIEKFAKDFEQRFKDKIKNISQNIFFENEIFTSVEAKWGIERSLRRTDVKNKKGNRKSKKENLVDHKAASMILKSFLEKKKQL